MPGRNPQELKQALGEIAAIRGQMARAAEFRGYGPLTLAATALVALAAGWLQPILIAAPLRTPTAYAIFWSGAAVLAASLIALEAVARSRRLHAGLADAMIRAAVEQFAPAALAGLLLTVVLLRWAQADAGLLPGLWQVTFSLGVFATCRFLPRATVLVGAWYLVTGLWAIAHSPTAGALAPWVMAAPFAVGQALAAVILWHSVPEKQPVPVRVEDGDD